MNRNLIAVCLVTLAFLSMGFPLVQATGGTPASFNCETTRNPPTGFTFSQVRDTDVDREGNSYYSIQWEKVAGNTRGELVKVNPSCVVVWSVDTNPTGEIGSALGCSESGFNYCRFFAVEAGADGRVIVSVEDFNTGQVPQQQFRFLVLEGDTGALSSAGEEFATLLGTSEAIRDLDSLRVSATEIAYLGTQTAAGKLYRFNSTLVPVYTAALASGSTIVADAETDRAYVTVSGTNYRRVDQTSGATTHTGSLALLGVAPTRGVVHGSGTEAFAFHQSSDAEGATLTYSTILKADFTTSLDTVAVTPNQLQSAGVDVATTPAWFDLDAADNFLVCGGVSIDTTTAFVGQVLTSNDTLHWNLTFQAGGGTVSTASFCQFDYVNGFYVAGTFSLSGTTRFFIRHYSDGGFSQPVADAAILPPEPPEVFEPVDFGSGLANFAADIGFDSEGSLFFFGLVLVIIMFLVVAGATKGVSDSEVAAGVGGGIAGMGTMIFNTTQDLWPPWTAVVLIVLTSATILWFTRGLFIGGRGD